MITKKRKIGDFGEEIAVKILRKKGFTVIDQNYLKRFGEIDIISSRKEVVEKSNKEKAEKKIYYFFEVKTSSVDFDNMEKIKFLPEDNLTIHKMKKYERIVDFYVQDKKIQEDYFLGVIFVYLDRNKKKAKVKIIEKLEL